MRRSRPRRSLACASASRSSTASAICPPSIGSFVPVAIELASRRQKSISMHPSDIGDKIESFMRTAFRIAPDDPGFNRTIDLFEAG